MNEALVLDDCWKRIGAQGDRSCPRLETHIHCRNCPVHSAAAAALLDGVALGEDLSERTLHYARPRAQQGQAGAAYGIFRIGAEWLALPAQAIAEITEMRPVHPLPHRASPVLGLVNVRGQLLICVSLGALLGIGQDGAERPAGLAACPRLVVLNGEGGRLVVPVDEVHGIERIAASLLQDVPATVGKAAATYTGAVFSWRERSVGCLDADLLLYALNRSLA